MPTIPHLCPGDRVALLSASSAVPEERLEPAVAAVRTLGLDPVMYPSCFYGNRHGNLAHTDAQRAKDLMDAFLDPSIRGVLSIRGGYGAGRLLPMLDWDAILAHPKFFSGYSDVTALHIPLNNAGLVTHHTVMPSTEYYEPVDALTMGELRRAVFGPQTGTLPLPAGWRCETLVPGAAEGPLVGGNLTLVAASLGTPWELDTRGKLLFLEDVDEEPYRVDGMLTQLRNAGKFRDCAGIILGYWTNCVPADDKPTLSLDEVLSELLGDLDRPVLKNLPCGHDRPSLALPLGAAARLDAAAQTLTIL